MIDEVSGVIRLKSPGPIDLSENFYTLNVTAKGENCGKENISMIRENNKFELNHGATINGEMFDGVFLQ